jgi:O-acetylhomoserine (thiol)-lyase
MQKYCENGLAVANYLQSCPHVESVRYAALPGDRYHTLAQKYLPKGTCGVISFVMKGGREPAVRFMDSLKLASKEVHVADIRTCVLHPASATHRQLTEEQLKAAGVNPGLIRISAGLEHIDDILEDISQAMAAV